MSDSKPESKYDDLTFSNAPNWLTVVRMCFAPLVVGLLFLHDPTWDIVAALCFGVAAITDYFDGYLARSQKVVTIYGKLMDPLADKILVVSSLVMLQDLGRIHPVIVIILICREMAILGLRALASAEGVIIAASRGAQWKTGTQMVAIPFLMVNPGIFGIPLFKIGMGLLYLSLAMSLWTGVDYAVDFFKKVTEKRRIAREARRQALT